jgi:hypothetical protein
MQFLIHLTHYSALLPILAVLIYYRKINAFPIWVILFYSIYTFLSDEVLLYLAKRQSKVNYLLYYFTLAEYLCFAAILISLCKKKAIKYTLVLISICFSIFCAYWIFVGNFSRFDSLQTSIECIIIILFCLYYLFEQLSNPIVEFLFSSYRFWIILSLLIYLSGAFFLFAFAADLPKAESDKYWPILYVCSILRNILFTIAVYLSTRPQDEEPYESLI